MTDPTEEPVRVPGLWASLRVAAAHEAQARPEAWAGWSYRWAFVRGFLGAWAGMRVRYWPVMLRDRLDGWLLLREQDMYCKLVRLLNLLARRINRRLAARFGVSPHVPFKNQRHTP